MSYGVFADENLYCIIFVQHTGGSVYEDDYERYSVHLGQKYFGSEPTRRRLCFFDLWSKPRGLLYLLERMKQNGCLVRLLDMIHEAPAEKKFGREKITSTEIEKLPLYRRGIKRRYHRFGLNDVAAHERLAKTSRPDFIFLTSAIAYWYGGVRHTISLLKETFPSTPIVAGTRAYARRTPRGGEPISWLLTCGYLMLRALQ